MAGGDTVPLFPLKTVLFPGGVLPLRIFEARYVDMVGRCLRNDEPFGVLAIVEGSEAGPARTRGVGTLARIVDFRRGDDGLLGIVALGGERFEAAAIDVQPDGLYVGRVEVLEREPRLDLPERHRDLARLVQRVLPSLGDSVRHMTAAYDDATWVGYRLAEMLPLSVDDKQTYLEMNDAAERLERLRLRIN